MKNAAKAITCIILILLLLTNIPFVVTSDINQGPMIDQPHSWGWYNHPNGYDWSYVPYPWDIDDSVIHTFICNLLTDYGSTGVNVNTTAVAGAPLRPAVYTLPFTFYRDHGGPHEDGDTWSYPFYHRFCSKNITSIGFQVYDKNGSGNIYFDFKYPWDTTWRITVSRSIASLNVGGSSIDPSDINWISLPEPLEYTFISVPDINILIEWQVRVDSGNVTIQKQGSGGVYYHSPFILFMQGYIMPKPANPTIIGPSIIDTYGTVWENISYINEPATFALSSNISLFTPENYSFYFDLQNELGYDFIGMNYKIYWDDSYKISQYINTVDFDVSSWNYYPNAYGEELTEFSHTYSNTGNYYVEFLTALYATYNYRYGPANANITKVWLNVLDYPPNVPTIAHPGVSEANKQTTIYLHATDLESDKITYIVSWGDGDWDFYGPYESGAVVSANHVYYHEGDYTITVVARDNSPSYYLPGDADIDETPVWVTELDEAVAFAIIRIGNNNPPVFPPPVTGPTVLGVGVPGEYSVIATDPDGDDIRVRFNWGDGLENIVTTDYQASDSTFAESYVWNTSGTYYVTIKVEDLFGYSTRWQYNHEGLKVLVVDNPSVPQNIVCTPYMDKIKLDWSPPAETYGAPVTRYDIKWWNQTWTPIDVELLEKIDESQTLGSDTYAVAVDDNYIYVGAPDNVYQFYKSNLTLKTSSWYGSIIRDITVDDDYVYVGGSSNYLGITRQYWKSNMTLRDSTGDYGNTIYTIAVDDDYIYVGGSAGGGTNAYVRKYLKSNMSLITSSVTYGGGITSVMVDDTYVYAGGLITNKTRRYLKSNLSYIDESPSYGGNIYSLDMDDTYIYVGGDTTSTVRMYNKNTLAYTDYETENLSSTIYSISVNDEYIYVVADENVSVFRTYDLTKKAQSELYGGIIRGVTHDDDYVYSVGLTTKKVYKYLKPETEPFYGFYLVNSTTTTSWLHKQSIIGLSWKPLQLGTNYTYQVRAVTEGGASDWSSEITCTPGHTPPGPFVLQTLPAYSADSVQLTWGSPVFYDGATLDEYNIYESTDGTNFYSVKIAVTTTTYLIGLTDAQTYYWKILCNDTLDKNTYSNIATTTIDALPPTTPVISSIPATWNLEFILTIEWTESTDSGSGLSYYEFTYDDNSYFNTPAVVTTSSTNSIPKISGYGKSWFFKVRAVDNVGHKSAWSNTIFTTITGLVSDEYTMFNEIWFNQNELIINQPSDLRVTLDSKYRPELVKFSARGQEVELISSNATAQGYQFSAPWIPTTSGGMDFIITVINEENSMSSITIPIEILKTKSVTVKPRIIIFEEEEYDFIVPIVFSESQLDVSAYQDEYSKYRVIFGEKATEIVTLDLTNLEPTFVEGKLWIFKFRWLDSYNLECVVHGNPSMMEFEVPKAIGKEATVLGYNNFVAKYFGWLVGKKFNYISESVESMLFSSFESNLVVKYK